MAKVLREVAVLVVAAIIASTLVEAARGGALPAPTRSFVASVVPGAAALLLFVFSWRREWSIAGSPAMALVLGPLFVLAIAGVFAGAALALMSGSMLYTTGQTCLPDFASEDVRALLGLAAASPGLAIGMRTIGDSVASPEPLRPEGAGMIVSLMLGLVCIGGSAWILSIAIPHLMQQFPPAIVCGNVAI